MTLPLFKKNYNGTVTDLVLHHETVRICGVLHSVMQLGGGFRPVSKVYAPIPPLQCSSCERVEVDRALEMTPLLSYILHGLPLSAQQELRARANTTRAERSLALDYALIFATILPNMQHHPDIGQKLVEIALEIHPAVHPRHVARAFQFGLSDILVILLGRHPFSPEALLMDDSSDQLRLSWALTRVADFRSGSTSEDTSIESRQGPKKFLEKLHVIGDSDKAYNEWWKFAVSRFDKNWLELAEMILEKAGDINERCGPKGTPLQTFIAEPLQSPYRAACKRTALFLLDHGAKADTDNEHEKPLDTVLKWLENNAPIEREFLQVWTAYDWHKWLEIILKAELDAKGSYRDHVDDDLHDDLIDMKELFKKCRESVTGVENMRNGRDGVIRGRTA